MVECGIDFIMNGGIRVEMVTDGGSREKIEGDGGGMERRSGIGGRRWRWMFGQHRSLMGGRDRPWTMLRKEESGQWLPRWPTIGQWARASDGGFTGDGGGRGGGEGRWGRQWVGGRTRPRSRGGVGRGLKTVGQQVNLVDGGGWDDDGGAEGVVFEGHAGKMGWQREKMREMGWDDVCDGGDGEVWWWRGMDGRRRVRLKAATGEFQRKRNKERETEEEERRENIIKKREGRDKKKEREKEKK